MSRAWPLTAAALAASGTAEALLLDPSAGSVAGVAGALVLAATVLAVPARPHPGAVLVLLAALLSALTGAHPHDGLTPIAVVMLAAVGVGRGTTPDRRGAATAAVLAAAALGALVLLFRHPDPTLRALPFFVAFLGASFALGQQLHGRALERDDLQARRRTLERERAEQVADAVARERERIAAELHAIIATSVDRVADGAARADAQLDADPDAAVATLREVRGAASAALTETRRLLGLLRAEEAAWAPQPGIPSLADRGYVVRVAPEVGEAPLPAGLELALVRLVEEAVAAVEPGLRPGVRVAISRTPDEVAFTVAVAGPSSPWRPGSAVLAGMGERARLYGGGIERDDAPGRWTLRGRLPLVGVTA